MDRVGPALSDAQAVGSLLNIQSTRVAQKVLELWRKRLTGRERGLLVDYSLGTELDHKDPFPEVYISLQLGELDGPLLKGCRELCLNTANKKALYQNCVKVTNKKGLCGRTPTAWTTKLKGDGLGPQWKILYKPPLRKRTADLQWRILHGAIASNAFISVINPAVSNQCPFCLLCETAFHVFSECKRLAVLFTLLTNVFNLFSETFSMRSFIYDAGHKKANQKKWQLLNFISGRAKLAIHVTRKNKVENKPGQEAATAFCCSVRCRLRLEFSFYKMIKDLQLFKNIWCYNNILCTVVDDQLKFAHFLVG